MNEGRKEGMNTVSMAGTSGNETTDTSRRCLKAAETAAGKMLARHVPAHSLKADRLKVDTTCAF